MDAGVFTPQTSSPVQQEKPHAGTEGTMSLSEDGRWDAELRNHNREVEAIKCRSRSTVAALLGPINPMCTPFSRLLHT